MWTSMIICTQHCWTFRIHCNSYIHSENESILETFRLQCNSYIHSENESILETFRIYCNSYIHSENESILETFRIYCNSYIHSGEWEYFGNISYILQLIHTLWEWEYFGNISYAPAGVWTNYRAAYVTLLISSECSLTQVRVWTQFLVHWPTHQHHTCNGCFTIEPCSISKINK